MIPTLLAPVVEISPEDWQTYVWDARLSRDIYSV